MRDGIDESCASKCRRTFYKRQCDIFNSSDKRMVFKATEHNAFRICASFPMMNLRSLITEGSKMCNMKYSFSLNFVLKIRRK